MTAQTLLKQKQELLKLLQSPTLPTVHIGVQKLMHFINHTEKPAWSTIKFTPNTHEHLTLSDEQKHHIIASFSTITKHAKHSWDHVYEALLTNQQYHPKEASHVWQIATQVQHLEQLRHILNRQLVACARLSHVLDGQAHLTPQIVQTIHLLYQDQQAVMNRFCPYSVDL
ncbi:MAG: hypothetical protein ACMXYF_02610 [Candidatus Woesearchaeota archaeon]